MVISLNSCTKLGMTIVTINKNIITFIIYQFLIKKTLYFQNLQEGEDGEEEEEEKEKKRRRGITN